jgi:hypothetical protein
VTVILDKQKLTYVAVPKVACTSIKTMFFSVENDFPFRRFSANGRDFHIHTVYPSVTFDRLPQPRIAGHTRLAVVRDPIRRFLSCYSNRVVNLRNLSQKAAGPRLAAAGLPPDPDLPTFVANLEAYAAAVPDIHHHALPQVDFLGSDPAFYARVFGMGELDAFLAEVERVTGRSGLVIPRLQTGGPKIEPDALSATERAKLVQFYAADTAIYGRYI